MLFPSAERLEATAADPATTQVKSRVLFAIAWATIIAIGVVLRVQGLGRSFWLDEAWVANSVIAGNLHGMFFYDHWLQTTPPLFLLLARASVALNGLSETSLRLVPLVFGVASIGLAAWLGRRIFPMPFALLLTAFTAVSPDIVMQAKSFKQYTGELAMTYLLLAVLWGYHADPTRIRFWSVIGAFGIALMLSYTAVMLVPAGVAVVLIAVTKNPTSRADYLRPLILLAFCSIVFVSIYLALIRPNREAQLDVFWSTSFPRGGGLSDGVRFYYNRMATAVLLLYRPSKPYQTAISLCLRGLMLLGVAALAKGAVRRDRREVQLLVLAVGPITTLLAMNLLRLYPVDSGRLNLFIVPCLAILTVNGLGVLWSGATRWSAFHGVEPAICAAAVAACVLSVAILGGRRIIERRQAGNQMDVMEDAAGAFGFLKAHALPSDLIYLPASVTEQARLYFRLLNWSPPEVETGDTGWPCCARGKPPERPDHRDQTVLGDLASKIGRHRATRVWVASSEQSGWQGPRRKDAEIVRANLGRLSCQNDSTYSFKNLSLDLLACEPN